MKQHCCFEVFDIAIAPARHFIDRILLLILYKMETYFFPLEITYSSMPIVGSSDGPFDDLSHLQKSDVKALQHDRESTMRQSCPVLQDIWEKCGRELDKPRCG